MWDYNSSLFHYLESLCTAKLGSVDLEYITPAREWIIISYEDRDQNQTYLHKKMKWQIAFWNYVCVFHSCVCQRFIYYHNRSAYSAAGQYVVWTDSGNLCINSSQTHECRNWDWSRLFWEHINRIFVSVWLSVFMDYFNNASSAARQIPQQCTFTAGL